jgi:hypothetical protein
MKNKSEKVIKKKLFIVSKKILAIVFLALISFSMIGGTVLNLAASGQPTSCERSRSKIMEYKKYKMRH